MCIKQPLQYISLIDTCNKMEKEDTFLTKHLQWTVQVEQSCRPLVPLTYLPMLNQDILTKTYYYS